MSNENNDIDFDPAKFMAELLQEVTAGDENEWKSKAIAFAESRNLKASFKETEEGTECVMIKNPEKEEEAQKQLPAQPTPSPGQSTKGACILQ